MTEVCTVCGGEIPPSLITWMREPSNDVDDAYAKGVATSIYQIVMDAPYQYVGHFKAVKHGSKFKTKFYLSEDKPVCFKCLVKGCVECYFCGAIHTNRDEPFRFRYLAEDQYLETNEYQRNPCSSYYCQRSDKAWRGQINYPGYKKDWNYLMSAENKDDKTAAAAAMVLNGLINETKN